MFSLVVWLLPGLFDYANVMGYAPTTLRGLYKLRFRRGFFLSPRLLCLSVNPVLFMACFRVVLSTSCNARFLFETFTTPCGLRR